MATFLDDDLATDEWQKRRSLQVGTGDPNGGIDPAAPTWVLHDGMPSAEWQRVRALQQGAPMATGPGPCPPIVGSEPSGAVKAQVPGTKQGIYTKRDAALDLGARFILDRIAVGEAPDQPVSYDTTYGYGAFVPPGSKPVTQMSFAELAELQEEMLRRQSGASGKKSRPVGKYQFQPETVERMRKALRLKSTDIFTPGVQDMMARELLQQRGYGDYLSGKIDATTLQENLSAEWASVPQISTGKSRYNQRIGTTTEQMQAELTKAKAEAQRRITETGADPYAHRWR